MTEIVINRELTIAEIRRQSGRSGMAFYGANTPWWTLNENDLYTHPGTRLPCDPRGGMLLQTREGDWRTFLYEAELNPQHYGKHGIRAFLAAYHGVVLAWDGQNARPTCLDNWDAYNDLIDKHDAKLSATPSTQD